MNKREGSRINGVSLDVVAKDLRLLPAAKIRRLPAALPSYLALNESFLSAAGEQVPQPGFTRLVVGNQTGLTWKHSALGRPTKFVVSDLSNAIIASIMSKCLDSLGHHHPK